MPSRPLLCCFAGSAVATFFVLRIRRQRALARTQSVTDVSTDGTVVQSSPLVIVVGIGGVGSHVAQLLLRGGVRRLRLIDFDQVTLSSLNRHATATRIDVGTPKVLALRDALLRIDPSADIDARVQLFDANAAAHLLSGDPACVVDAIDDLTTKAALLSYCVQQQMSVICALGAGGKADACALHVGRLSEVVNDPIATTMLRRLRKERQQQPTLDESADRSTFHTSDATAGTAAKAKVKRTRAEGSGASAGHEGVNWWEDMSQRVTAVYSSELQRVTLLPLPEGTAASELGSQPNFRVRIMPVLPPLPAAVGAAVAAHVLAHLAAAPALPPPRALPALKGPYQTKLYRAFVAHEIRELGRPASELCLAYHEVPIVVCDMFRCRCPFTGRRLHDPNRPAFCLVRYDANGPADITNVLFATTDAAAWHEREGCESIPHALRQRIECSIAEGLTGRCPSYFDQCLTE